MNVTKKLISELTAENITVDVTVSTVKEYRKVYGFLTTVCRTIWALQDTDNGAALALVAGTVRAFGAGGEGTDAYKNVSSFKTVLNRIGHGLDNPVAFRWKRDSDGVLTELPEVKKEVKPATGTGTDTGTGSAAPQHVEAEKPQVWTVKALVENVMENKPRRTKVSTVIIGLLAYIGKGGLVEVMTACQKLIDAETTETETTEETDKAA